MCRSNEHLHRFGGLPFIDFTQSFIFAPLDLQVTHAATHDSDQTSIDAKRYNYWTTGVPYNVSHFDGSRVYGAYGWKRGDLGTASGGWVMTARDLVRLMCATDQLANQSDILTPESLNEMESVPYPSFAPTRTHGWGKAEDGTLGKDGETIFSAAYMAKYPTGINVAIVVNTGGVSGKVRTKCGQISNTIKNAAIPATYDLFGMSEGSP
jgi:CubicO group peptidase (beta-lactamase class C family)